MMAGKLAEARHTGDMISRRSPDLAISQAKRWLLYKDPALVLHRCESALTPFGVQR
jgi:hypothetical protein